MLDADVVIECVATGVWKSLKTKYSVAVGSIAAAEAEFAKLPDGSTIRINLESEASANEIAIFEASALEMQAVLSPFARSFAAGLHHGEIEGLAIIKREDLEDCRFCTGDNAATEAVGMLGLGDRSISLEEALGFAGINAATRQVRGHFSARNWKARVDIGKERRITGMYFHQGASPF